MLAVGHPLEAADVGVVAAGELLCFAALLHVVEIDFGLAGSVAYPGDILAVGAPVGTAVIGTGAAGDVAGDAGCHRNVEHFTAGGYRHPAPVGRDGVIPGVFVQLLLLRSGVLQVGGEGDVHLLGLFRGGIELVDVSAVLEDDVLAVCAGELDVEVLEIRDLGGRAALGVIHEEVHAHVPVGREEHLVAYPHREDVLGVVGGDVPDALAVVDPHVVGHAAAIVLPGAEFAHDAVVCKFLSVSGIAAPAALRKGNLHGHRAVGRHFPELAWEAASDAVAEDYILAVGSPAHHDVVGAHAVAHVVAGIGGGVCNPLWLTAFRRNHVDFAVAVIFGREGYGAAVGRIMGEGFVAYVRGEPPGHSARRRNRVKVAGIGEGDFFSVGCGEAQQPGLLRLNADSRKQRQGDDQEFFHIRSGLSGF